MKLEDSVGKKWYAVYTKSHFEKKVNRILEKKKIITFLPLRRGRMRIGRKYRLAKVPLFRSYLFVNISRNGNEYNSVLNTTGVSSIVKRGRSPCPVSDATINSLKTLVEKMNEEISVLNGIKRGKKVQIVKGPLENAIGEMVRIDSKKCMFIVNVDILGRAVEVLIPPDYVIKI
jgi:transcription antitermination factor NusG